VIAAGHENARLPADLVGLDGQHAHLLRRAGLVVLIGLGFVRAVIAYGTELAARWVFPRRIVRLVTAPSLAFRRHQPPIYMARFPGLNLGAVGVSGVRL
jgi:hypothetical protein